MLVKSIKSRRLEPVSLTIILRLWILISLLLQLLSNCLRIGIVKIQQVINVIKTKCWIYISQLFISITTYKLRFGWVFILYGIGELWEWVRLGTGQLSTTLLTTCKPKLSLTFTHKVWLSAYSVYLKCIWKENSRWVMEELRSWWIVISIEFNNIFITCVFIV